MKGQLLSGDRPHRRTTKAFARLGIATLVATLITTSVCCFKRTRDDAAKPPFVESSAVTGARHGLWYIRLGQWRADARTVIAVVRYVLENDSEANHVGPVGLEVAMPTNSASVLPRA